MNRDLKEFDKFKKDLGKRWSEISVYKTTEMLTLAVDSFKPCVFALLNKGLDVNYHLNNAFNQIKNEYLCLKITEKANPEENPNGTLRKFIEGQF